MRHRTGRIAGAEQAAHGWRDLARSRRDRGEIDHTREDSGFTLVEVVMTIVLISMTIIPILDATFTSIKASATVREVAEIDTLLQNAADRVNRAPTLCDYSVYIQAAALAKGWDATNVSGEYQYYVAGASARAADAGHWESGACPNNARTPRLIQMVTISARTESGSIKRSIQVVKSDV